MGLTKEILDDVLRITRQVSAGDITLAKGKDELVRFHGFNPNSASMTIRSLRHLMNGERYRRALTIDATAYFLGRINDEDGAAGLQLALTGLAAHIEYRHQTGVAVPGLQAVLARHRR